MVANIYELLKYILIFGELYKQNDKMSENSKKEEHSI